MTNVVTSVRSKLILCAFVITPLVISTSAVDITLTPRLILICGLLSLLATTYLLRSGGRVFLDFDGNSLFWIAVSGYLVAVGISIINSFNQGESIYIFGRTILPFCLLIMLGSILSHDTALRQQLPIAITISALIVAIVGFGQLTAGLFLELPGNIVPYSTMANKNLLASYLLFSLPFSLMLLTHGSRFVRSFGAAVSILLAFMMVASKTRSVWVALLAATAVTGTAAVFSMRRMQIGRQSAFRLVTTKRLLGVMIFIIALEAGNYLGQWDLSSRAASIITANDQSIADRLNVWSNSLKMAGDHPIFGVGPGQWRVHVAGFGMSGTRSESGVTNFQRPHNDYLWVLSENGLTGLIFYLAIFVAALSCVFRRLKEVREPEQLAEKLFCLFGISAYLIVAFFSYPQERVVHQMLLVTLFAFIMTAGKSAGSGSRSRPRAGSSVIAMAILLIAVAFGLMAVMRYSAEKQMRRIYFYKDAGQWPEVIRAAEESENFFTSMDPTAAPLRWFRGVAEYDLGDYEGAFQSFQSAYQVNPNHLYVLNNLATSYVRRGKTDSARSFYEKALRISPNFEDAVFNLTAVYFNSGELEKADDLLGRIDESTEDVRYTIFRRRLDEALGDSNQLDTASVDK